MDRIGMRTGRIDHEPRPMNILIRLDLIAVCDLPDRRYFLVQAKRRPVFYGVLGHSQGEFPRIDDRRDVYKRQGFGCVLDGSERIDQVLKDALLWDVMSGVARRAWSRNENAITTSMEYNEIMEGKDHITLPYLVDDNPVSYTHLQLESADDG